MGRGVEDKDCATRLDKGTEGESKAKPKNFDTDGAGLLKPRHNRAVERI